jgi:lipid II:glycine glycyltransferase (peptidoglycan interpeptide bridge formation enzyme)
MKIIRPLEDKERAQYNAVAKHPLQTWEWGEFRKQTGVDVERLGVFDDNGRIMDTLQVTFHPIPHTSYTAGYFPKGIMPDMQQLEALQQLGFVHNALYIKMEPNVLAPVGSLHAHQEIAEFMLKNGAQYGRPLFTQYTFFLDLKKTEEKLLEEMKPKTRYNIRLAEKKGVTVVEDSTDAGLEEYIRVLNITTARQKFYAHNENYYRTMWKQFSGTNILRIFKAVYEGQTLVVWMMFVHNKMLYYPYGASTDLHRDVMASNLMMWRMIQFGREQGCEGFDMWGALGPDASPKDRWYGFHKFKEGYGAQHMQSIGSFDLVMQPLPYKVFRFVEELRWKVLRLVK